MSLEQQFIELTRQFNLLREDFDNLVKPEVGGWKLISETVLTGSVASVSFSNISSAYKTLVLVAQARTDAATEIDSILATFNSDSGANYDRQFVRGNDTTLSGNGIRAGIGMIFGLTEGANSRASNFSYQKTFIFGYARTDREKWCDTVSASFGDVSADADMNLDHHANRWRNTSAITSIQLSPTTGTNFVSGSRFTLYGIF